MILKAILQNRAVSLLQQTITSWLNNGALRLSAALAYYSIFSIAPLLIIVVSMAGLVFGEDAVRGQLDSQISNYVGPVAAASIQSLVQGVAKPDQGLFNAITGFAVLLVGASGVFGQLKDALNTIWEVKTTSVGGIKGFIWDRLLTFGMVLVIGFLLLTSLMLSTAITALNNYLNSMLGIPVGVWAVMTAVSSLMLVTVLFAIIFKILPDVKIQWRDVWIGAAATAVLFEIGKFGLGLYLGRASMASAYGAAGSVILLLLWIYYASCILLFGAEFTKVYATAGGRVVQPAVNAEHVTDQERAEQGLAPALPPEPALPIETKDDPSRPTLTLAVVEAERPKAKKKSRTPIMLGTAACSFIAGVLVHHCSPPLKKLLFRR